MTMPVPADEYPLHQAPLSLRYAGTTERNFYDRWYFNAHDRTGERFLISGMGFYPHLGVVDAFVALQQGSTVTSVRFSDALDGETDRLHPAVGPYGIEIDQPLQRLRIVCDGDEHGLGVDLTWTGSFPPIEEARQIIRHQTRTILDTTRFAQVGTWQGEIRIGGERLAVDPDVWVGSRDRSWGIRPVGEPDTSGRLVAEGTEGFYWLYAPLRFDDHAVVIIVQERPDGYRTLNDATRVWADGRVEQLGWPRVEIRYRPGTRIPQRAVLHLTEPDGKAATITVDALLGFPLHVGCGYGPDPDWAHGQWKGRDWALGSTYDLGDPTVAGRVPFGVIDHVGRAEYDDGRQGWGLFEHANVGRHDPSGFADFTSVAP